MSISDSLGELGTLDSGVVGLEDSKAPSILSKIEDAYCGELGTEDGVRETVVCVDWADHRC